MYDRGGDACGWWRARSAVLFPAGPDLGAGGVGDVGGEGGVGAGWMIVSVAALLVRVVWALE